jgi:hypothetical protein
MTWLAADPAPRSLGHALALRPDLQAGYHALEAALAAEPSLDPALLTRCRARVAALFGVPDDASMAADDVAVEFTEQLVLDAHGVTDDLVTRLAAVLSPRAIVTLAQAIVVWEGQLRIAHCLDVTPER